MEKGWFYRTGIFLLMLALLLAGCGIFKIEVEYDDGERTELDATIGFDSMTETPESRTTETLGTPTAEESSPTSTPTSSGRLEPTSKPTAGGFHPLLSGMVYRRRNEIWMVNESDQEEYLFDLPEGWVSNLSLSPDGHYLLYAVSEGDKGDIWISALPSGETRNITNTPVKIEQNPIWWPTNPLRILYGYFNDHDDVTMGYGRLASMDIYGEGDYSLMDEEVLGFFPAPSPDGKTVAFQVNRGAWLYHSETGLEPFDAAAFGVSARHYYEASWSPDGSELAWIISVEEDDQKSFLYVIFDLEAGKAKLLHSYPSAGCDWYRNPLLWSPDGKWITFMEYCPEGGEDSRRYLLNVDGQKSYDISEMSGLVWKDESTLAYHRKDGIRLFHLYEERHEVLAGFEDARLIGWISVE